MTEEQGLFILSDVPHDVSSRAFSSIADRLITLLPYAEIEHVGSTAVQGCVGKGDIDILVRVREPDFTAAAAALDTLLARSTRNDSTDVYIEYDWLRDEVSASVQLVTAGSLLDRRFRGLKSALLGDPRAIDRYNSLKVGCAGQPMELYRARKAALIDELLAGVDSRLDIPVRPGVSD